MSSTEKARSGRGGKPSDEMPAHVAEIDHLVCIAPPEQKIALIVFYTHDGRLKEKASKLGLSRWVFMRRVNRGESFIAMNL